MKAKTTQPKKVSAPSEAVRRLQEAARSAADWLCASHPGSDQWERGFELMSALAALEDAQREAAQ